MLDLRVDMLTTSYCRVQAAGLGSWGLGPAVSEVGVYLLVLSREYVNTSYEL